MSISRSSSDPPEWVVDVRLHTVSGLPQTDPNIRISAQGDDACRWATVAVPSLRGTAFLGAWATLLVRGATALEFEVDEEMSVVQLFKWSRFRAVSTLRLGWLVAAAEEDLEQGLSGVREISLVLLPVITASKKKKRAGEAEAAAAATVPDPNTIAPTDRRLVRSSTRLMSPNLLIMRVGIRVLPLATWLQRRYAGGGGAYLAAGAALELSITPLPRDLHTYAHGAFMGLAPSALEDSTWRGLLEELDPSAFTAAQRAAVKARVLEGAKHGRPGMVQGHAMDALENSPVLAAYGLMRCKSVVPVVAEEAAPMLADADDYPVLHTLLNRYNSKQLLRVVTAKLSRRALRTGARRAGRAALLSAPESQVMAPLTSDSVTRADVSSEEASTARQAALERRQAAAVVANACGYRPMALEWDIWLHPKRPGSLESALISHGSAAALVTQAVTTQIGARGCAQLAGRQQIAGSGGMSPAEWVSALGTAINVAVCGDRNRPLPLPPGANPGSCWRLVVECIGVEGLDPRVFGNVWVTGDVDSDDVVLPRRRSGPAAVQRDGSARWPDGASTAQAMSFYPLPLELEYDDLLIKVHGTAAVLAKAAALRLKRRRFVGAARVRLDEIVCSYPRICDGEAVEIDVELGQQQVRRVNVERPSAGPRGGAAERAMTQKGSGGSEDEAVAADDSMDVEAEVFDEEAEEEEAEEKGLSDVESLVEEDAKAEKDELPGVTAAAQDPPRLRLRLSLQEVPFTTAMTALGVPSAAAQTAVAMLSSPGGIYLDIKSAYSTPYDIQLFVSSLRGIGVSVRAVCSFSPAQLRLGPIADAARFFHGLSGLENACDAGEVAPGTLALFNGASFLVDFKPVTFEHMGAETAAAALGSLRGWPLDDLALRKHQALCDAYGVLCGLYVQEPDAAPAGVDALCALVAAHPEYFPLGLAYGYVSGRAVAWLDAHGRGFAAQQVVEELEARKDLSSKAIKRVAAGEHRSGSLSAVIVLAGRLVAHEGYMSYWEQRALCTVLADVQPDAAAATLVAEIGGIEVLVTAFHHWYELITPLTLLESGWNWGFTKSLLRLLRNRGVLAALTVQQKVDLGRFFCGPGMRGYGLTYLLQMLGVRRGLHKHAKEGLCCLLESCTAAEARRVTAALGGPSRLDSLLRGWLRLSWHYSRRVADVAGVHRDDSAALAYRCPGLRYASLDAQDKAAMIDSPEDLPERLQKPTHTRDKGRGELTLRWTRRSVCCVFTLGYTAGLEFVTLLTFLPCCVLPRLVGVTLKGKMGLSAILVTLLAFVACFFGTLAVLNRIGEDIVDKVAPGGSEVEGATTDLFNAVGGGN